MLPVIVLLFVMDEANEYALITPSITQLIIMILDMATLYENSIIEKIVRNEIN